MRKLLSLILILTLSLGLVCVHAEQDSFLISDWKLSYTYGGTVIAEQTIFIYEENTFEVMTDKESEQGTWTFDGETLVLSSGGEELSLKWNGEAHQFSGEYNGMALTMEMSVEPEEGAEPDSGTSGVPETGMLAGGWTVAEDQAITDDINNMFWQAMDSYQTGTITIAYTPVAVLGTQVVAGTNYAVLCRASEINKGRTWVIVYLYLDLEGNASILRIADLTLGV